MESGSQEFELPSQSDAESFRLPSDPGDIANDAEGATRLPNEECCQAGCMACILESPVLGSRVKEIQSALAAGSKAQALNLQFACLQHWNSVGQGNAPTGWRKYRFGGIPLCVAATCLILKLPAWKFKELQTQIASGKLTPDRSLKESQVQKEKLATQKANVLLSWLHSNVAESLVESRRKDDAPTADAMTLARKAGRIVVGKDRLPPPEAKLMSLQTPNRARKQSSGCHQVLPSQKCGTWRRLSCLTLPCPPQHFCWHTMPNGLDGLK